MSRNSKDTENKIRTLALETGFTDCGFAPARELKEDAERLRDWLNKEMHAGMTYMEKHFDKRTDPSCLVPGAKSVIVLLLNYYPGEEVPEDKNYILSKYAHGRDYHRVMKPMLKVLLKRINEEVIPVKGRVFVDSAPVLERSLAALAGLGWFGKHSNLISPRSGSFFFIGELIVDIALDYGKPLPDYCGGCTKCIQACPTQAIIEPGVIDSRRCISYWTIEHKGEIDPSMKGKFQNRIFGCDICQEVCPWNRKSQITPIEEFKAAVSLREMIKKDWQELTEEKFSELFKGSAVLRTKYAGLMRNIKFVKQ